MDPNRVDAPAEISANNMPTNESHTNELRTPRQRALSYKFERLREQLRSAVIRGELSGKLPGERVLAQRFGVNAKTLSKALTDLAAEGLLDRSIGRGTYVKGSTPARPAGTGGGQGRWLLMCDAAAMKGTLVKELMQRKPESQPVHGSGELRPSFLSQFSAVVDCARDTPDSFYRQMLVRGVPVVSAGEREGTISTHAVQMDRELAAFQLGRDLLLAGHRRLGAVDARGSTRLCEALRRAAARYAPDATVDGCYAEEVMALVENGVSGIVCDGCEVAERVSAVLARHGVLVPARVSLAAIGADGRELPCSGIAPRPGDKADAVINLLNDLPTRPTVLWLSGAFADRGTISPPAGTAPHEDSVRLHPSGGEALAS